MNTFDITKCKRDERGSLIAQTRDGRKVRILCTDGNDKDFPIVGFIEGKSKTAHWQLTGQWASGEFHEGKADLVNVPEKRVVWVNVYPANATSKFELSDGHETKEAADMGFRTGRLACVRVEFTEGQGL